MIESELRTPTFVTLISDPDGSGALKKQVNPTSNNKQKSKPGKPLTNVEDKLKDGSFELAFEIKFEDTKRDDLLEMFQCDNIKVSLDIAIKEQDGVEESLFSDLVQRDLKALEEGKI